MISFILPFDPPKAFQAWMRVKTLTVFDRPPKDSFKTSNKSFQLRINPS